MEEAFEEARPSCQKIKYTEKKMKIIFLNQIIFKNEVGGALANAILADACFIVISCSFFSLFDSKL